MKSNVALRIALTVLLMSIFSTTTNSTATSQFRTSVQDGGTCTKLNQTVSRGDYQFTCVKRLNRLIWASTALKTPPYFAKQNILQFTSAFAPATKIEYIILFNGEDIHGIAYPSGTRTTVRVDGRDSNYLVTPKQPITIFLPNVLHKFVLMALVPKLASQASVSISVPPLDISIISNVGLKKIDLVPPSLQCAGSGETSGAHPGWSSVSSVKLTVVDFGSGSHAVFWCPAAAPNGSGKISYTVTASPSGYSCETRTLTCVILGITGKYTYQISATDETGTYDSGLATVQSTGTLAPCIPGPLTCNISNALLVFNTYGNIPPTSLGDCTFAAIANWEQVVFGVSPDSTVLGMQFSEAGGTYKVGLSDSQTLDYWEKNAITGISLVSATPYPPDPEDIRSAIDNVHVKALIASLHAEKGQFLGNFMFPAQTFHWLVVDGYTQRGPLVVTWGQTIQMTWQQWNREVGTVWQLVGKISPAGA